jgi:hypothetical protein
VGDGISVADGVGVGVAVSVTVGVRAIVDVGVGCSIALAAASSVTTGAENGEIVAVRVAISGAWVTSPTPICGTGLVVGGGGRVVAVGVRLSSGGVVGLSVAVGVVVSSMITGALSVTVGDAVSMDCSTEDGIGEGISVGGADVPVRRGMLVDVRTGGEGARLTWGAPLSLAINRATPIISAEMTMPMISKREELMSRPPSRGRLNGDASDCLDSTLDGRKSK